MTARLAYPTVDRLATLFIVSKPGHVRRLGRPDLIPETLRLVEQRADAAKRAREKVDLEEELRAIRGRVARAELDEVAGLAAWKKAQKAADAAAERSLLADFQVARLEYAAVDTLPKEIAETAWPTMRKIFSESIATFTGAASQLPKGVKDDQTAMKASGIAQEWLVASEASAVIGLLWSISEQLRDEGLLQTVRDVHESQFRYLDPSRVHSVHGEHRVIRLKRAIETGAEPWLAEAAEVRAVLAEIERQRREDQLAARRAVGGTYSATHPGGPTGLVREAIAAAIPGAFSVE